MESPALYRICVGQSLPLPTPVSMARWYQWMITPVQYIITFHSHLGRYV